MNVLYWGKVVIDDVVLRFAVSEGEDIFLPCECPTEESTGWMVFAYSTHE